jgi:hypothetical protein
VKSPYLFRSYDNFAEEVKRNPGPADDNKIWEVARATSAAHLYFDEMEIDGKKYFDGGLGNNNPTRDLLDEVAKTSSDSVPEIRDLLNIIVSVGTGLKPTKAQRVRNKIPERIIRSIGWFDRAWDGINHMRHYATDVNETHEAIRAILGYTHCPKIPECDGYQQYARFHGGDKVGGLKLDEWRTTPRRLSGLEGLTTKDFIDKYIAEYLALPDVQAEIIRSAKSLVELRHARIKANRHRWRRFSHVSMHKCPRIGCRAKYYPIRTDAIQHVRRRHTIVYNSENVDQIIKEIPPRIEGGAF